MRLIERIDAERDRLSVLRHPFYVRWEQGDLTRDELAAYAGEYRHAVVALADATAGAEPLAGPGHAAEERAHVDLWDDFAASLGSAASETPTEGTQQCVGAWTSAADPLEALAIAYAVEAGQPAVARTKLDGLVRHYGYRGDEPATAYFSLHAELDHEHAAEGRDLLEAHATPDDEDRLVAAATRALEGNWALLDAVS